MTVALRRRAVALAWVTVVWNTLEAVVAVAAGAVAGSIALIGFGLDSLVEVFAGGVVLWRMRAVGEDRERVALRLIALSFFALAAYVTVEAAIDLARAGGADPSPPGIALAVASLVVMPVLAAAKRRTGRELGSPALVAESAETMLCTYLSVALLAGLVLNAMLGWSWADPLAGLFIAWLAAREGRSAWRGESCREEPR